MVENHRDTAGRAVSSAVAAAEKNYGDIGQRSPRSSMAYNGCGAISVTGMEANTGGLKHSNTTGVSPQC
jgi:hypothetical protein